MASMTTSDEDSDPEFTEWFKELTDKKTNEILPSKQESTQTRHESSKLTRQKAKTDDKKTKIYGKSCLMMMINASQIL